MTLTRRKPSIALSLAIGVALAALWLFIAPGNEETIGDVVTETAGGPAVAQPPSFGADAVRGDSAPQPASGGIAATNLDQDSEPTEPRAAPPIISDGPSSRTVPVPMPSPTNQTLPPISPPPVAPVAGSPPTGQVLPAMPGPTAMGFSSAEQIRPPIIGPATLGPPPADQNRLSIGPATVGSPSTDQVLTQGSVPTATPFTAP